MILWKLLQQSARCGFNRKIFSSSFMRFWDRTSFIVWRSQPAPLSSLLKAGRLSSFCLSSWYFSCLRLAQCNSEICLTKRADHLNQEYLARSKCSLSLSDVWSLIRPHFYWFIAAVISAILVAVVNIGLPIYLGELIDRMVLLIKDQSKDVRSLNIIKPEALKLILCYSAQAVLTFFYITFLSILGERVASDLRLKLFNNLVLMDMSFHDAQKSAELSNRLNVDVQEFKSSFKLVLAQGIKTATQVTGCFFILVSISPKLTLYTVSALPLIIAIGTLFGALLRSLSRRAQAQFAVASCVADEAFSNIRTVRAFAMEEQESKIFKREVLKACSLQEMLGMGIGLFQAATNFFLNGIVLSVLYGGSSLITSGEITPGQLMSFLVTAQTIQKSMSQFSQLFGTAVKGWTAGARVFQFANMQPSICTYDGVCIPYHSLFGEVRFENVKFAYPARPEHCVFENLNLTIPAGHVVAFCGASGEGKTTITSLLERFYEPLAGRVLLDNHDLRTLNLDWLRGQVIGLISQEPVLFATTIEENIRYGRPNATNDEVIQAAELANAHQFIIDFPDGYQTVVGERGVQLSGGQKQRIAIARALLKNPPILVLDEATSALDSESENLVREALDRAMKGRTVIIIAHRLSTIRNADLICVVKDKKICEQGSHNDLMKKEGVYYNLIKSQAYTNL